jgi:hypothetical protein
VERVAYIRSFASCHVNKFIQESQPIDREIALVYLRKAMTISPTLEKEVRPRFVRLYLLPTNTHIYDDFFVVC